LANKNLSATLTAEASVVVAVKKCRVDSWSYSGDVAVDEEVRVSGIDITAELDGANSASYFTGSIFDLLPGANDLIYTDSEGTRTVRITVVKSDLG